LPHSKKALIDWIYFHQITEIKHSINTGVGGFRGSTSLVTEKEVKFIFENWSSFYLRKNFNFFNKKSIQNHNYDCSHVTMTFSALNSLLTLGDDLSRIDKKALLESLGLLQLPDGSITATFQDFENDVRFLYSACSISYILNDWSAINKEKASKFLLRCMVIDQTLNIVLSTFVKCSKTSCL